MALSGLHIVFTYGTDDGDRLATAIIRKPAGSATITTGQVSTAAPVSDSDGGSPVARLIASEAGFYAVGRSVANASSNPRGYLPAGETIDILIESGDKIAWLTA